MTFLKWSMLLGLATIAIPIIIHLLNRSKPRPIEWGAMQFLLTSITARSRRVLIEDGILLCLRCLALALLALAMARPFLPSMSSIPWASILPCALLAVICAGMAAVLWSNELKRRRLLKFAASLLTIAIVAAALEHWIQARRWLTAGSGCDTAIIVDASLSMTIVTDGQSNFSRAVTEARTLIEATRPGDACALILGGPVPQPLVRRPTSDRRELLRVLQEGEFHRVGGEQTIRVNVRVLSATNRDLTALVAQEKFREDLYHRLNGVTIQIPPLRERREDIPSHPSTIR